MTNKFTSYFSFSVVSGILLFFGTLWLYGPVLMGLFTQLAADEDYSFGLLLPLVSAYLIYRKWPQIKSHAWRPSWLGLAVMVLGIGFYVAGRLGTGRFLARLSFVVFLAGLVSLLGGWGLLRLLSFPLLLLLLMLPPPLTLTSSLTLPLQLLSTKLAAGFLRLVGVPLLRQGNVIDLGDRQLQVVAACSGLRYILSLAALSCIYCYFFQRRPWKVAVLLGAAIPAAILANAFRVAGMGLFPVLQDPGFWHDFSGWVIFLGCFIFLALLDAGLNRLQPESPLGSKEKTLAGSEAPARGESAVSLKPFLVAALVLLALALPLVHRGTQVPPVPLKQSFADFPMHLGPWTGSHVPVDQEMVKATGCHDYLNMDFTRSGEQPVSLWIAYYRSQETEGVGHNPRYCLPGSGWETVKSGTLNIAPGMPVNYLVMENQGQRILVYFWNLVGGRWITNDKLNKFYLIYSGLRWRRTDASLVRLIIPLKSDIPAGEEELSDFARLLVPVLPQFLPN